MQLSPLSNNLCFRLTLLYHEARYRTSVLFYFCAIHLPPAEEGEFLLYYVKTFEEDFCMLTKEELPECPVAITVGLIGSKWKLLILRNLLARPWRFNELKKILKESVRKY